MSWWKIAQAQSPEEAQKGMGAHSVEELDPSDAPKIYKYIRSNDPQPAEMFKMQGGKKLMLVHGEETSQGKMYFVGKGVPGADAQGWMDHNAWRTYYAAQGKPKVWSCFGDVDNPDVDTAGNKGELQAIAPDPSQMNGQPYYVGEKEV